MLMVYLVGGTCYCRSFTPVTEAISLQSTNVYHLIQFSLWTVLWYKGKMFVKGD